MKHADKMNICTVLYVISGPNVFDFIPLNPFTAPSSKMSGLKDARTRLQTAYFLVLQHIYFQSYAFS